MERTRIKYALAIGVLAWVASHPGPTTAAPVKSKAPARVLFAYESGQSYKIALRAGKSASVNFRQAIQISKGVHGNRLVPIYEEPEGLLILPHRDTPDNTTIDVQVKLGDKTIFFEFTITRSGKTDRLVEVLSVARSAIMEEVEKHVEPIIDANNQAKDAENLRKRLWLEGKQAFEESGDDPIVRYQLIPDYKVTRSSADLTTVTTLRPAKWDTETLHVLVPFELEHHDPKAFRLGEITAARDGENLWAELVYIDGSTMPTGRPPEPGELLAQVEGEGRIRGAIAVKPDPKTGIKDLTIGFGEPDDTRWIEVLVSGWTVQEVAFAREKPPKKETLSERMVRESRENAARERRAKQFMIGPLGGIGACWLVSGEDGSSTDELEAAMCHEYGMRLTYPAFVPKFGGTNIAFEAELIGGWTQRAAFEGLTIDGVQGDLSRRATFGRGTFGFAARFGDRKIPYFRLGLGMQAARHRATFSAGDDPDSSFDFGFTLAIGGGVDIRLTENLLLGAAISGGGAVISDHLLLRQTLRAGFHLRYGWDQ